ncbi:uncharacterized protein LOC129599552 isoform X2 [Paramacrobiotus metropolitanus]|uniref:uncharacterized protein LOC129599552 isoform X2 n=1 Tax=Paramacrobiotus metropolitanus TaxID=2943436 RepID=UPI002446042E|nr:uncharacterized protein LOC129599552 isoform X2 [Paramacrobiotus metropolitanus]
MAAQRAHYPDPPLNPYESPGYYSYAPYPRAYEQPTAYDHAPLPEAPAPVGPWRPTERPVGRDGLPMFPASPPQPYVPRYMTEREAALLQCAPPETTAHLQGPGHLAHLDVPAYHPEVNQPLPRPPPPVTPRSTCPRCGANCLCNQETVVAPRSRPASAMPRGNCEELCAKLNQASGVCRRCGASCACNCAGVGQKVMPGQSPASELPSTAPGQVRKWMNLPQGAAKIKDRLYQYRQDHKISGYAGHFPNTHNMLGGSIYRLTSNEQ